MGKHKQVPRWVALATAIAVAALGLSIVIASLANGTTRAAPLRQGSGNADPGFRAITITANLPISDTRPHAGVTRTVYFSNSMAGVITLTVEITGTPTLTLTAGAAFDEGERTYTSEVAPAAFVVTYAVGTGAETQPSILYTATNTNGVTTTVAITYVRDIIAPVASILSPPAGFFTGTTLVITGTAEDNVGGAGVRRVQVTTGTVWTDAVGTATWAYTTSFPSADGAVYTLSACAGDFLGIVQSPAATRVITVDNVAPAAQAPIPHRGPWITSTVVYTWPSSTDGSGISGYWVNVTNTQGYTATFWASRTVLTFSQAMTEGAGYYARVRAVDGVGNVGGWSGPSAVVTPDLTAPTVTYRTPPIVASPPGLYAVGPAVYYSNTGAVDYYFIVQGSAADALSGPGSASATPALGTSAPSNGGDWQNWAFTYRVPPGASGSGWITVTVSDAVGLTASRVFTYTHDPLSPTGAITIQGGLRYSSIPTVTLTLFAADNPGGSGVADMCINESAWEPYATTRQWTLTGGDGDRAVYVRYRDRLGNVSTVFSDTIFLDRASPAVTVTAPSQTSVPTFLVSWNAIDPSPGSGVVSYTVAYRQDGGGWITLYLSTTQTVTTFSGALDHTYVFSVTAYDYAGNRGQGTATTKVEYYRIYLPLTLNNWVWWHQYDTYEPNDTRAQAYGPLIAGQVYTSYIYIADDQFDFYTLTVTSPVNQITLDLVVPGCCDYDLYLYDSPTGRYIEASNYTGKGRDERIIYRSPMVNRVYYILVYSPYKDYSNTTPYSLEWKHQSP